MQLLDIESSPNCDFDFLMLTEGDPIPEGPAYDDASWPSHVFEPRQSSWTRLPSSSNTTRFVDTPIFPPKSSLAASQRVEKLCGTLQKTNVSGLNLASSTFETWTNTLWITFKSDGTLSGTGFSLRWSSFQLIHKCQREVLTKSIGSLQLPVLNRNGTELIYVNSGSNQIVCSKTFIAPVDHRVVLTFHHFNPLHTRKDPEEKSQGPSPPSKGLCSMSLMIQVGSAELEFCPNELGGEDNSSAGNIFISNGNRMVLRLHFHHEGMYFGSKLDHTGIWMNYKIESNQLEHVSAPLLLSPEDNVRTLTNINYPLEAPSNLIYATTVTAPSGFNIRIALPVGEWNQECGESYLEILDPYKIPKKAWRFCQFDSLSQKSLDGVFIYVQSFLGIIHLRQVTGRSSRSGLKFKIQVELSEDRDTALKVIQMTRHQAKDTKTDVCDKNLCFNGGRCDPTLSGCVCQGHFIGPHCLQTACDSQPCHNGGVCQLTRDSFSCICPLKFGGKVCDRQLRPCEQDPCSGNGICHEQVVANGHKTFRCQCHLWWAGPRCDRRMTNIPYKPLSSRMIEEPFWLGLLTVLIVLLIIGICWFLKKHLPERLEKILVDDMEIALVKDRSIGATFRQYTPQVSVASDYNELPSEHRLSLDISPSAAARTLLSKLSVRKPSILSVSSTASSIGGYGERKNSTSQEELFIKRTPSPKRRNRFLSPRDEEERRKILKSLVTPKCSKNRHNSLASFDQLIIKAARSAEDLPETSNVSNMFRKESASSLQIPGMISPSALLASKKVTFSHVVDQLACSLSESSSLSDLSCADDIRQGIGTSGPGSKRAKKLLRSSRIPSKRKHSLNLQSNNHGPQNGYSGSEEQFESSMESLESSCTSFPMRSMSMLSPGSAKQARHLHKISSADSLLSMIKSLAAQKGNNHAASTPSSPQLSVDGSGGVVDSALSSPINPPETLQTLSQSNSPRRDNRKECSQSAGHQIKVEIHDHPPEDSSTPTTPTNAQSGNPGVMSLEVPGFHYGKCLSPIKELPSPMPTPVASPLPNRNSPGGSQDDISTSSSTTSCSTTSSRRSSFRNRHRKKGSPSIIQPIEPMEVEEIRSICVPRIRRNSYNGDGNAPTIYQETSFVVPMREMQPQVAPKIQRNATIPKITLTMHDDSLETATSEPKGEHAPWGEPFSPKPKSVMRRSTLPENILIPQVFVSCVETSQIQSVVSPKNGRLRHRPPPLIIPNSNFQDSINSKLDSKNEFTKETVSMPPKIEIELQEIPSSSSSSPIRQQPTNANPKGKSGPIGVNSDVIPDNHPSLLSVHVESPKFLAPDNFDSAPRSRSQSVELPEFRMTKHELCSVANRRDRPLLLKRRSTDEIPAKPPPPIVNAKVMESGGGGGGGVNRFGPPSSVGARKPTRDERMSLLLKQRSLPGGHPQVVPPSSNEQSWKGVRLGSPTLKRDPPMFPQMKGPTGAFPPRGSKSSHIRSYDKPQSLDLPGMTPTITITPMSDLESDNDSPIVKTCPHPQGAASSNSGMHYLSPFTINTTSCGSRTTSESNLSSSGYSSMASPGPSRSGSSNPLCYESEDTSSTPTSSSGFFSCGSVSGIINQGVFIRRPSPLLKSPSVDSESSDPNQAPGSGSVTLLRRNNGLWRMHEKALQYSRTDSETTDEQCIPESISTANDSAIDSQEDINDDEDTFNPEGVFEESGQMIPTPVSFKSQSPVHGSPTTFLEVRDSSTESDKTVLSMVTLVENTSKDSLPSTPGLSSQMSLPLPEIVVNEALSLGGSSEAHTDMNEVQDEWQRKSDVHVPGSSSKCQLPKASSVPPLGHHGTSPSSNMEYEPLLSCSTVSASSSRSESPMSERIFDKCSSSLLSLHNAQRLADSDGALEYPMGPLGTSIIHSPSSKKQYKLNSLGNSPGSTTGSSSSRRKKRSNKRRVHLNGTVTGTPTASGELVFQKSNTHNGHRMLNGPFKNISNGMISGLSSLKSRGSADDMPDVCSPRKSLIRKKLKSQQHQSTKSEMPTTTSSSNESLFSNISLEQGLHKVANDSKDDPHFLSVKLSSNSTPNSSSVSSGDESGSEGPHKESLLLATSSSNSSSLKTSSSSSGTSKTGSPFGSMALLPIPMKLRQQRLRSRRRHGRTRLSSESLISATRDHE
ncbi:mucin-2-like [Tigriopus californicus]|uniref:mucin-2-like n=1 Tax=Tigriopus californicus TaxID=6832 RepID=UPI0027DAB4BC|nr:mucin-2-like [Tigriopus californicus]